MKQYTTPEQTAKLIELGFEKPRIDAGVTKWEGYEPICTGSYTLGELIEMLPPKVGEWNLSIERYWETERWCVSYACDCFSMTTELIDALYNMIVKLKDIQK
jgi:hypothetical protein